MARCLLIDRNDDERARILRMLESIGLDCHSVSGANEGIIHCAQLHPDVVLMEADLLPQAKDFLKLARFMGRESGRPVIIFYSAAADVEVMGDAILEGASEFLVKPFDQQLLRFKLRQAGIRIEHAA
jgi:two-component system chemotaxis response regulator CheY